MAQYIRLSDLQYPFFEGDIRNLHPEITDDQTGPTFPALQDFAVVAWSNPPPVSPPLEYVFEGQPAQTDAGGWQMTWLVGYYTPEQWAAMTAPKRPVLSRQKTQAPDEL